MKASTPLTSVILAAWLTTPLAPAQDEALSPQPGPEHKVLAHFVGKHDFRITNYMAPEGPQVMVGTEEITPICGGLWLLVKVRGTNMPFEGMGLIGYDSEKQKYVSVWVDSWSPFPILDWGTYDKEAGAMHFSGQMAMPDTVVQTRTKISWDDQGRRQHSVGIVMPDQSEQPMMLLVSQKADGKPFVADKSGDGMPTPKTEAHTPLQALSGTWNVDCSGVFPGMDEIRWNLQQDDQLACGGLWLHSRTHGPFMGAEFEGHGLLGFDAVKQEYVSYWVDSMSTSLMALSGHYDQEARRFSLRGKTESMMGTASTTEETTLNGEDRKVMVMRSILESGEDAGTMRLEYQRAKQ